MSEDRRMHRRTFLEKIAAANAAGGLAIGAAAAGLGAAAFHNSVSEAEEPEPWTPVSSRKVKIGIVGHGHCQFGAAFGFQNHPNVEIVAVSDLFQDRREALMAAVGCDKSYPSLEELVKDDSIEAVFAATDAPHHAQHCREIMRHGKHAASAVPAAFGSIEDGERLLETVQETGQKYMMFETSCFRPDNYAMRTAFNANGFGPLIFSEGEYHHYHASAEPTPSYLDWRRGVPPMWYPTHSTAYYVGVTRERFTSVSCIGSLGHLPYHLSGGNPYDNPMANENALFETSEGASSRMAVCWSMKSIYGESGRVFGQRGCMNGTEYSGLSTDLPSLVRPALPPGVPGGGHGGSHGYLMNEFVEAILEDRQPLVDVYEALAMTIPGIVAHESAMRDGERLPIPQYGKYEG